MKIRISLIFAILLVLSLPIRAQPGPGDIFKEFTFVPEQGNHFSELNPKCKRKFKPTSSFYNKPSMVVRSLDLDLKNATKAEMAVEYWAGHTGTSEQKFKVNGHEWIYLPQPRNTPGRPECYYRTLLGNQTAPIPLTHLKNDRNDFQFTCGRQICYGFDWGMYWVYSFTVRVYYDSAKTHPTGEITAPQSGASLEDEPLISVDIRSSAPIKQVDFIGYYEDFDWEGNGLYEQWHWQSRRGVLHHHIGTVATAPYQVRWDNLWVPDQNHKIKIMARITDENSTSYITESVGNISLQRPGRVVKMYKPSDVPENFGVRVKQRKTCTIVIDDDLSQARTAKMVVSTWSGKASEELPHEIGINGKRIANNFGRHHDYSYDMIAVPLEHISKGTNEVYIYSEYDGHMLEVNWPGPVLIVEYTKHR